MATEKILKILVATTIVMVLVQIVVYVFFSGLIEAFYALSVWYIYAISFFFMAYVVHVTVKLQSQYEETCKQNPQLCSE
ncbi:MAG: hypothetical protein JHC26_01420 [Thermofilum sp.]|uniref:hypothetical protein n=1 Tax=Thermofilum sp. TaxID=1961369 RepID=UPI002584F725|nr:hypothetical protein [Thermofilum sp.]MCI4407720.1 hypothetical protein [Thermofilum sp.]